MHSTVGLLVFYGCFVHQAVALPAPGSEVKQEAAKITLGTIKLTGINLDATATSFSTAAEPTTTEPMVIWIDVTPRSEPTSTISVEKLYPSYHEAPSQQMATGGLPTSKPSPTTITRQGSLSAAVPPYHTVTGVRPGSESSMNTLTGQGSPYTAVPSHESTPRTHAGTKTKVHGQPKVTPVKPGNQDVSIPQHATAGVESQSRDPVSGHEQGHTTGSHSSAYNGSFQHHSTTQIVAGSTTTASTHPTMTEMRPGWYHGPQRPSEHYPHYRPGGHYPHRRPAGTSVPTSTGSGRHFW
ncbi:hypothetical protein LTR84_002961 [Exophiala bonariae]|uniref:Uncharacterized protein n=1 Tax=Exophiala bonariae TaxID=1690606 RepID=A0AAV9NBZ2_9EURO|nr:hypothetical protein LTR84_002961 [Exophiala bonariae]